MKSKQVIAKYEGHLHPVSHLAFANGTSHTFITSSNSECLFWNPKEHIKQYSDKALEISQPDKILDLASSDLITGLAAKEISADTFMVGVTTDLSTSVFYVKSTGSSKASAQKSKTVKKES